MKDIKQLFEQFVDNVSSHGNKAPETIRGYRASFELLTKFHNELYDSDLTVENLTEEKLVLFAKYLKTRIRKVGRDKEKRGVKYSTIATYRGKLKKFFEWLKIREIIKINPYEKIPYPPVAYEDKKYLPKKELHAILATVDHGIAWTNNFVKIRNSTMFTFMTNLGLRKGEMLGLRLSDIDFDNKWITVRAETSKSRRIKVLRMSPIVFNALNEYLAQRDKKAYKTEFLWISNNTDRALSPDGFIHLIRKVKKESRVNFHAHQFRHTFAVNHYNQKRDVFALQQLLGHTDIKMTKQYLRGLPPEIIGKDLDDFSVANAI